MTNIGGSDRHSQIVQLESRRIILQIQREYVIRSMSPGAEARIRHSLTYRRDNLTQQIAEVDASLRLLRDEPKD